MQGQDLVRGVLNERQGRYGEYFENAAVAQELKAVMRNTHGFKTLPHIHCESLEVIAQKIARILNGDPNYRDNWVDIMGYAQLVLDRIEVEE